MKLNKIITILSLFLLGSCGATLDFLSKSPLVRLNPPPGPPEFQAAIVDGCSLALNELEYNIVGTAREGLYKHPVYNHNSNLYRKIWRVSYIYCGLSVPYLAKKMSSSFAKPSFRIQIKSLPGSKRRTLLNDAPPGPANFRKGWKDGCNTGKGATGKSKHKMLYPFYMDSAYIEGDGFNAEYDKGWNTAFWYCQRYYDVIETNFRRSLL